MSTSASSGGRPGTPGSASGLPRTSVTLPVALKHFYLLQIPQESLILLQIPWNAFPLFGFFLYCLYLRMSTVCVCFIAYVTLKYIILFQVFHKLRRKKRNRETGLNHLGGGVYRHWGKTVVSYVVLYFYLG